MERILRNLLQSSTWAQKLFKDEIPYVPTPPVKAVETKCSTTAQIPTSAFPNNSKAPSLNQHNKIPGLFIAQKVDARPKKAGKSKKRKLETVFATSPRMAINPQQVATVLLLPFTGIEIDFDISDNVHQG